VFYYLIGAFGTLMIPTTLMGATLPILARDSVHEDGEIGTRIGALYAWNTAGAVALWLIHEQRAPRAPAGAPAQPTGAALRRWILPLMRLSGTIAFTHEVLWTRLLQHVVGGSVLAFGIMVASFLLGIALGGACGSQLARVRASAWWRGLVPSSVRCSAVMS